MEAAVSRKVDFVVVSGDIFDSVRASYRRLPAFLRWAEPLSAEGIPSYLCTGNHDPLSLWQQDFFALPPSATMLAADRPDFALYERGGRPLAVIGGRGYPNKVWSPNREHRRGYHPRRRHSGIGAACRRGAFCGGRAAHRAYVRSCEGSHRPRGIAARRVRLLGARAYSQAVGQRRVRAAHCVFRLHSRARCARNGFARCQPRHAGG